MNERQLKSFILAAETKSMSKAAAAAFISVPAFVQQINLLEDSLGFKLINRSNRGVTLTPSGEVFYQAAVQIIACYERAVQDGLALERGTQRPLRIGCPPEHLPSFVMVACRRFQQENQDIPLSFTPSTMTSHLEDLRTGNIDLAVMAEPSQACLDGLRFHALCEETFSFCMSREHPLSGSALLQEADLLPWPIVCGNYRFLKLPMETCVPSGAVQIKLADEYDMAARIRSQLSDELLMIHSHWANCYENMLMVVPSVLPGGIIGVAMRSTPAPAAERFLSYLEQLLHKKTK